MPRRNGDRVYAEEKPALNWFSVERWTLIKEFISI
jgi:hypothetical protein